MGSLGPMELTIILVIVLIIFGAGKIGEIGGAMGRGIREFRKASSGEYEEAADKADQKGEVTAESK